MKINKKVLMFGIPIFALALVSAVAVYYAVFSVTLNINQPIDITGSLTQTVNCNAGHTCLGDEITISNSDNESKTITITNNNWNDEVEISYVGELELTEKVVDFSESSWEIPADSNKIAVSYILVGDEFSAEVADEDKIDGYELVYYKDNSDRFSSPAKAIGLSSILGNLPYTDDKNNDEYDYCSTGEYSTCHGAKLWYVPSDAINEDGSLDWSRASEFFYESFLIQYNSAGEIVVYAGSSVTFRPQFEIGEYAPDWTGTITTTIA